MRGNDDIRNGVDRRRNLDRDISQEASVSIEQGRASAGYLAVLLPGLGGGG